MAMCAELTTAEVRRHEKVARFSAAGATPGGARAVAWVHSRGRLDKESEDGGEDLVVLAPAPGGLPQTVLSALSIPHASNSVLQPSTASRPMV
jgi:hypothetical protein